MDSRIVWHIPATESWECDTMSDSCISNNVISLWLWQPTTP